MRARWRAVTLGDLLHWIASGEPDLTQRQLAILLAVSWLGHEQHTVRGLAARLNVGKPIVSRAVNALERLGFALRVRDPADGRNVFIHSTPAGLAFLRRTVEWRPFADEMRADRPQHPKES